VHRLAEVSHQTWIRQAVRDKGKNEAKLSKDVHPHDLERAEDTVQELEKLGLWPPGTKSGTN
jgi:flagellar biosynthesis/type III secretory pathway protein FliH